jgi:hypothetical protein
VQSVALKDDFVQLHDVRVRELDKRLDLFLADALVPLLVLLLHALDRHDLA